jgi:arabinose-5-phosphate isomerase
MKRLDKARQVFDDEIAALRAVRDQLDQQFERAVELIVETLSARGKIVLVGIGKSGNIAQKIAATFTSTGTSAVVLHSVDALHGDLGIIHDSDLILALSYSGETEELIHLLPSLKRFSVRIISFTASRKSTLAKHSDLCLLTKVPREACPFNLAPTCSTTAMMAMGDALAMAVLDARGFSVKEYAKFHPAGSIGKTMLLRVNEIMRTGHRNPVAEETLSVKEGLLLMTRAKSGSLSVVNKKGKLAGVFTDGDLRRNLAMGDGALNQRLSEVMTRDPICVKESALAAEALKIFDSKNIDDLIVVNSKREPVGMIDSQDLPKLKLM